MGRLKILHICDKFGMRGSTVHGVSKLFAWWFPRFDTERFDARLYAVKRPDSASRSLESDGVPVTYMEASAANPLTLLKFLGVIRSEEADVVHLHGWIAANYGRIAGRIARVPTIMHEHGVDPAFPRTQRIADRILRSATDTAVAVSNSVRDFLIRERSVPAEKIRVIYNGAPLSSFTPPPPSAAAEMRRDLGVPSGRRIVGTVGRIDVQKGLTYLVRAARQVLEIDPNVQFVIVGDGPGRAGLEAEAGALGLASSFTFTGHRSDVAAIQSAFDVQAFPSLWEGTPLTVFEAMGTRRAIVSTNVDGLGEVLKDHVNALVVEPANPDQLATAILRVLSDHDLAERLREGALERSRDFDIDHTVRELESLYDELADRPASARADGVHRRTA